MIDARFAAYLVVAALLILTPGPDMALVTRNTLRAGPRAASATALGISIGILAWAVASAIGVGALLERSATAFTLLKVAGAVYLGYLGLRSLWGSVRRQEPAFLSPLPPTIPVETWGAFRQGILGNLLTPKAGIIFVTILPQFIKTGDAPLRLVLMLVFFEVMLLAWLNLFGYLVSRAGRSRAGRQVRQFLERVTGLVLIGLGVRLASGN